MFNCAMYVLPTTLVLNSRTQKPKSENRPNLDYALTITSYYFSEAHGGLTSPNPMS